MATVRAERLVNLVLCLLSTRQYLTAERIRGIVPGYADAPNDEAFFRMFERDKAELRDLGIPLETGRNSVVDVTDGYRIARRDYELGDIDLEPDEAAAIALAVRLWDSPEFTGSARGALVKLRAAGVDVDERGAPPSTLARVWVLPERAQGLRRQATVVGSRELGGEPGDVLELDLRYPESAASWIAGYGPDVVVLEPDTLRKAVYETHLGVAGPREGE